jgi:DNA-binding MarR family transcriptional regulator
VTGDASIARGEAERQTRSSTVGERPRRDPCRVPETLTSPSVKLVYLALAVDGPLTPELLRERLGLSLLTLFPLLERLVAQGFAERVEGAYTIRNDR